MGMLVRNRVRIEHCILYVCLLFCASVAQAHPHAWIYVGTRFVMASDGRITAIEQDWGYDNLLTDALLDDLAHESSGEALDLASWAADTIQRLQPFNYFLRLTVNGESVPLGVVTHFNGDLKDDELRLKFTAPLMQPIDPREHKVELAVFDPSFYIEILQHPESPPQVQGDTKNRCEVSLEYPEPSTEDFMRAMAIDRGVEVEPQFGALFAEKVHLHCQ